MARVSNPLIGRSKNKVGNVVFSTWKGINVLKEKPASVANPRTDGQVRQRSAFATLVAIARQILPALQVSFRQMAVQMSAYNAFVKANLTEAFTFSGGVATFVPANFVASKGTLPGFQDPVRNGLSGRELDLSWTDNSTDFGASSSDQFRAVIVSADGAHAVAITSEIERSGEGVAFEIPGTFSLTGARCSAYFVKADGSKSSDSWNVNV